MLDRMDENKILRMVDAGYTQASIAAKLGIDIQRARQLVRTIKQANPKPQKRRVRTRDVELRDMLLPGGDPYHCTTGDNDRYLAALKREFPERIP